MLGEAIYITFCSLKDWNEQDITTAKLFIFSGNIKDGSFWKDIKWKNKLNKLINEKTR